MILLAFCYLICKLSTSSAIADTFIQRGAIHVPGYFHWIHHNVASTVLYCRNCCRKSSTYYCIRNQFATDPIADCCSEKSFPYCRSHFYGNRIARLKLIFKYAEHTTLEDIQPSNETLHELYHVNGNLTIFPDNICSYPRLVEINVGFNRIENLINLRCIHLLDSLRLNFNKIKTVTASSFLGMANLRYLDLSYNLITYLEPGALKYRPGSLAYIDFAGNCLKTIDVSNAYLGYFFDGVSFHKNQISRITNELNWTGFQQKDIIGGGWINLRENRLSRIPPFSELGFKDRNAALRGAFNYRLFLEDNPWSCDCDTYQYISLSAHASINFAGLQFTCASPPSLQGYSPRNFRQNPDLLNYLICNVGIEHNCPPRCHCYKQPAAKRVVVNCSSTGRSKMPKVVPEFDDLDIDLSYNSIKVFENLSYLKRATKIDLSYNLITFIDPAVYGIDKPNSFYLAHNQITILARSVQLMNPCKLWFGNITLKKCNCEMHWIKVWLQRQTTQKCNIENVITCQKDEKSIDLMLLSEADLCPITQSYLVYSWFAVAAPFIMLISGILYYNFRFEVKLLLRRVKLFLYCNKSSGNLYDYDLYVSFNTDNSDALNWTVRTLKIFFENHGYKICLPPRDFNGGAIHVEEIYTKISKSKSFVVVLSQDYERSQFQTIEWKHIWNTFMTDSTTTITIINFDFLRSKDIVDQKLKSFVRLGYSLNFFNFHKNIMNDIQVNIGPPIHQETAEFWMP